MSISNVQSQQTNYDALISGKKINSAADDAAGLAISKKLETQETSFNTGSSNAAARQDVIRVADGALSSIQDSLQRIREIGVQASNSALYSSKDLQAMQKEVDGLKQSIQDTAKGTSFNTMKLLDGSKSSLNLATNPQGGGMEIQLANSTLESLGIEDFDVTGDFSLKSIDEALKKVSDARSSLGAQSNALEHTMSGNSATAYNTAAAKSGLEDADYGKEITEQKKNQVMEQYRMFSMKAQAESQSGILKLFEQ